MKAPRRTYGLLRAQATDSAIARGLLAAQEFIHTEQHSGVVLLLAALVAIVWANSPWRDLYFSLLSSRLTLDLGVLTLSKDLQHWVNDGLMTVFFFAVGLEIKRELTHGELSDPRKALLPVGAAFGGMIVPAVLYRAINPAGPGAAGWGIPMATDIAFALGVLALVGTAIPTALRLFLLTLAVVDDIGAILVIAVFYTETLSLEALGVAALILCFIVGLNRLGLRDVPVYALLGVLFWLAVLQSGVHATIAGVVLGLLTPSVPYYAPARFGALAEELVRGIRGALARGDQDELNALLGELEALTVGTEAPVERLERSAHQWASYVVLPLFALANAGVTLSTDLVQSAAASPITAGVVLGLVIGKPVGIALATWLMIRLRLAALPTDLTALHLIGVGTLAGIGFTVSLFIAGLAFDEPSLVSEAKVGIFAASIVAGLVGYLILRVAVGRARTVPEEPPRP